LAKDVLGNAAYRNQVSTTIHGRKTLRVGLWIMGGVFGEGKVWARLGVGLETTAVNEL